MTGIYVIFQVSNCSIVADQVTIFATFGKYLSDQIPQGTLSAGQELPQYIGKFGAIYCCVSNRSLTFQ